MTPPLPLTASLAAVALGYLLGSIPFGLLFAWLSGAGDVRKIGSGNIGATNVLRTGKKWAAAATLVCDGAKGAAAVLLAERFLPHGAEIFAALAAVLGHVFPVWLRFKGGKGVATFLGVSLALCWQAGLAVAATWLIVALIARISSLSALAAIALSPFYFFFFGARDDAPLMLVLAALIFFMHRDNIRRLIQGEEPRIGAKTEAGMAHSLDEAERRAWLRLARTEHVGPVTFAGLIARFGSASAAIAEVPRLARRGGAEKFQLPPEDDAAREIAQLAAMGGRMIAACEDDFPQGLAALEPKPPLIALLGHTHLLKREMIAIVGARNASALARKFAQQLARDLADAGLVVVSGLARGIDSAAHEAALQSGTIAVVAGGIDIIYPPENGALYEAIRKQGAVISEMRLGEAPQARHFPRRNRLISGLSRGVVVVEAAERSGSLITANYALEQGREIFAVPGSPLDPRAKGANRLIREGAQLIESAEDILATLRPMLGREFCEPEARPPQSPTDTDALEAEADRVRDQIIEALGPAPVEIDELIRQTGAPAAVVLTIILELELAGRCRRHPGNRVSWA